MNFLKILEFSGSSFYVSTMQKRLGYRGSSNSETVCFKLDRYIGTVDLYGCYCTIKTKNSEGKSDLIVPNITADDKKMQVLWTLSSGTTAAAGQLQVQLQFEKIFSDKSQNIIWQSNVMEFEIADSLDAADVVADQNPTLFQQWEDKVNTLYSDTASDMQSVKALQSQVKADADTVSQQKQSIDQTAVQVTQNAQAASKSEHNSAISEANAQTSATQAHASAADANTAQGLAKGYSDAAKTYSDAAAVSIQSAQTSAQSAQKQAEAAQEAATEAQQKIDAFSGYAKTDIDDGFANAFLGEKNGGSLLLDDVKANTDFIFLKLLGSDSGVSSAVITTCGKNLLDYTKSISSDDTYNSVTLIKNGFTMTKNGAKTVTANIPLAIPAGTAFVVSTRFSKNSVLTRTDIPLRFIDSAGTSHYDHIMFSTGYEVITAAADYKSIQFYFESKDADGSEVTLMNPQIELGNVKTDYEKYCVPTQYAITASAPLLSGDSYELVSGVETHSQAVYQHPAQNIPVCAPNATIITNAGTLSVKYCRDSNAVLKKIQSAIGITL